MLALEDFNLDDRVTRLLYERNITDQLEILKTLERYKFVDREEIIGKLKDKYADREFTVAERIVKPEEGTRLYEEIKRLTSRFDVAVDVSDETEPIIYVSIEFKSSIESLTLAIPFATYEIKWVTQCNLEELQGKVFADWDYLMLYKRITMEALELSATDIHLGVKHVDKKPVYTLRFRVNNDMVDIDLFDFTQDMNKRIILSLIEKESRAITLDLDSQYGIVTDVPDLFNDGDISLRPTAHKIQAGYQCVSRIQRMSTVSFRIPELGFPKDVQDDLSNLVNKRGGLTLITGMIRSGKNGTAFALGNEMQDTSRSILDWSSPIETLMGFPQADYGGNPVILANKIKLTKKLDADIVFINEIPDKHTAVGVLDLINSGVHVVTTTHINRIWQLPYKLYEYYREDYKNIITHLNICVNQRMLIKQCPHCTNESFVTDLQDKYRNLLEKYGVKKFMKNKGCSKCRNGNLKNGLQPYVERIVFTDELKSDLLRLEKPYEMEALLKKYVRDNHLMLEESLAKAVGEGKLQPSMLDSIL